MIQETVLKKFDEVPKRCPLVKEESDLSSSEEEGETRIANLIDFFFTIVRSQKEDRKASGGTCFKPVSPTDRIETYTPAKVNTELEQKMETLIEFLASTGCMDNEEKMKENKKITLMEFLFGSEDKAKPIIEINAPEFTKGISLSESNINVKGLAYIDETPVDEGSERLVEMLMKYMDDYSCKDKYQKAMSITPLSEKSKSDVTISKLETFSDISKTKSDSTLTQTQDTVIDRDERSDKSRRISETVVDLSHIKEDLEDIFKVAVDRLCEIQKVETDCDTMSEQEDVENFNAYTKPMLQYAQYLPYSVELSDIIEEDETSSNVDRRLSDTMAYVKAIAEELLLYIEEKVQHEFEDSSDREFDIIPSLKRSSISLIDLRNIPDLPPSMMIKPKVIKVDKSTSTTEISDSYSDLSKRMDSACMTEDTSLSNSSERTERVLDKLESLNRFFSKSRLEIIDESLEENGEKHKISKQKDVSTDNSEYKAGQASLDDVEDIQDDFDVRIDEEKHGDDVLDADSVFGSDDNMIQ